jgi:hypothetical protein
LVAKVKGESFETAAGLIPAGSKFSTSPLSWSGQASQVWLVDKSFPARIARTLIGVHPMPNDSIKARMQAIGDAVAKELPAGHGFFVLCFPLNVPGARGEYVSNGQRSDVIKVMKDFIARNPMQEIGKN